LSIQDPELKRRFGRDFALGTPMSIQHLKNLPRSSFWIALALSLFPVWPLPVRASEHQSIQLRVGEQKTVPFKDGIRYSPSGSSIRVTRVHINDQESLLVRAERPGRATLMIWSEAREPETISFQVLKNQDPLLGEREQTQLFLNSLEDTKVIQTAGGNPENRDSLLLQGEVKSLSEGRRIRSFVKAKGDRVTNQTYPSLSAFKACLRELRQNLQDRTASSLKVEFSESERWVLVTGTSESEIRATSLESQLGDVCPWAQFQIEVNSSKLDLIRLKVVLIENYQSESTLFGVQSQWRTNPQLQLNSGKWLSQFGVLSSLKALETRGKLKILSQPEIVLRTPGEAELFSGGEIPIETTTRFQSQVFWKNFGLALKVKSLAATSKKVRLDLSAEVSQIDRALSTDSHPGLQSNRLKTQVEATFSEPLLLSGLFKSVVSQTESGTPFLSRLPFFNLFFSESQSEKKRTELLAILIPYREVPKLSREKVYGLQKKF
jgi:Flp pilus assembly secretin CpaC